MSAKTFNRVCGGLILLIFSMLALHSIIMVATATQRALDVHRQADALERIADSNDRLLTELQS